MTKPSADVSVGRVALVNSGEFREELVVIVDILSLKRVIVDGPWAGISRREVTLRSLDLLDYKLDITREDPTETVQKLFEANEIQRIFNESKRGQRLIMRARRLQLTDYERHVVRLLKKQAAAIKARIRA